VKRTLVSLALAGTLFIAAPAVAKPSLDGVKSANAETRESLRAALDAAVDGKARRASLRFAEAETAVNLAASQARRLSALSDLRGARGLTMVAGGADIAFADLSALIATLPPQVQARVAAALEEFAAIRGSLVAQLTELAGRLPEPARTQVLAAIAGLHDVGDLDALLEAIGDPAISAAVRGDLTGILAMVTEQLDSVFAQLDGLLAMLPPEAAAIVGQMLDQLQDTLSSVFAKLEGVLAGLPGGFGDLPIPAGVLPDLCGIIGGLPIPIPICP